MIDNEMMKLSRDAHQWILELPKQGINPKTKEAATSWNKTFHANLEQVAKRVFEHHAAPCKDLEELNIIADWFITNLNELLTEFK